MIINDDMNIELEDDLLDSESEESIINGYADNWTDESIKEKAAELMLVIKQIEMDNEAGLMKEAKWRRQADGQPMNETKNYPMPNSANLTPPLALIHHQTMAAEIFNYFSVDPFFTFKPFSDNDDMQANHGRLLTKYFGILSRSDNDLALKKTLRTFANEVALLGRASLCVNYYVNSYNVKDKNNQLKQITLHDGPIIDCIKSGNLLYPKGWESFEEMPLIARKFIISRHELMAKKASNEWENVDDLLAMENVKATVNDYSQDNPNIEYRDAYCFYDVCFYCDNDKDGFNEDYCWTIHEDGTVVNRSVNDFGMRLYAMGFYNKDSFNLRGKGTGQICEAAQDEVESLHNLRLDNMKIVNMRMFEIQRSVAMANDDDIYPGKGWVVDQMGSIKPIQFGEIYPSTMNEEQSVWHTTSQATSMSEVKRGFSDPNLGQRDTYRGQQMRLNQSKGLFGTIVDGLNDCFIRVGLLLFAQLKANRDRVIARERRLNRLTMDEVTMLDSILATYNYLDGFPFQVIIGAIESQEGAQLQALQMATGLYAQWAQQTAPLAQMVLSPQAGQMQQQSPDMFRHFASVYVGSTKFLENTLRLAGIKDYTLYTPDVSKLSYLVELMDKQSAEQVKQLEQQSGIMQSMPEQQQQAGGMPMSIQGSNQGGMSGTEQAGIATDQPGMAENIQ